MSFLFDPLPHTEAVARIATLPLFKREMFDELLPELKAYAFTISGLDTFDQLAKARDLLAAVPAGEKTWDKAKKEIAAEIGGALGGKEAQARAELLLRTHTFRAYAVTRYRTLMQQRDVFPFWQYKTHGDGRVRPSHAALNGKIFPAGHPIWQKIFPPNDWGCRCLVLPKMGKEVLAQKDREQDKAPEARMVYDGDLAEAIYTAQRLPSGESLIPSNTWAESPWSEPGTVRHTWGLVQERYRDQPEILSAFAKWSQDTMIDDLGITVAEWLDGAKAKAGKAIAATIPAALVKRIAKINKITRKVAREALENVGANPATTPEGTFTAKLKDGSEISLNFREQN
jgi:SPP1 gp7 family putative phage head morphogenesis protein